jgi:hypothetical protein
MKKKISLIFDDLDFPETEIEMELRGRKIDCTCDEDPAFCEIHNPF